MKLTLWAEQPRITHIEFELCAFSLMFFAPDKKKMEFSIFGTHAREKGHNFAPSKKKKKKKKKKTAKQYSRSRLSII
jgi:hypothetical protein